MKTLTLHIGLAKTGTTTIQKTLAANSAALEAKGLLYPVDRKTGAPEPLWEPGDHRWLSLLLLPDRNDWPPKFLSTISESGTGAALAEARQRLTNMIETIRKSDAPRVLISSEYLARISPDALRRLKALLEPAGVRFEVLCYYRNPAKSYASLLQQALKTKSMPRRPDTVTPISQFHSNYTEVFGDCFDVRLFDRAHLRNGDVLDDMLHHLGVDDDTIATLRAEPENTSGPAERVVAQHLIRSRAFQDVDGMFTSGGLRLNLALEMAEKGMELNRIALRPGIADVILHHNRDELGWLQRTYGLVFDDIDYSRLDAAPAQDLGDATPPELIEYDPEKTDELIARTIRVLCETTPRLPSRPKPPFYRLRRGWRRLVRRIG